MRRQAVGLGFWGVTAGNLCLIRVQSVAKKIATLFGCSSAALGVSFLSWLFSLHETHRFFSDTFRPTDISRYAVGSDPPENSTINRHQ